LLGGTRIRPAHRKPDIVFRLELYGLAPASVADLEPRRWFIFLITWRCRSVFVLLRLAAVSTAAGFAFTAVGVGAVARPTTIPTMRATHSEAAMTSISTRLARGVGMLMDCCVVAMSLLLHSDIVVRRLLLMSRSE
jgi:hypothetical protein